MYPNVALLLTNSQDVTSDYLCDQLAKERVPFLRYNTDVDCKRTVFLYKDSKPLMKWGINSLHPEQISAIVFRRPKPLQIGENLDDHTREHIIGEWSEAIEGFLAHVDETLWINHPARNCMASHKIEQLTRAKNCGLNVPSTIVTNDPISAENFLRSLNSRAIVKPLASGFIERENCDTIIYTHAFEEHHFNLLEKIRECPVMFQSQIPKVLDVRVTVLDDMIIAVALKGKNQDGTQRLDIRRDNMVDVEYSLIEVPPTISASIIIMLKTYKLRFAAFDFGITEKGEWFFFEINPNGQWAWLDIYANAGIAKVFISKIGGQEHAF